MTGGESNRCNGKSMMFSRRAALLGLGATLVADAAAAYDGSNSWMRFSGQRRREVGQGSFDREFVQDWENNPPKGFPTLGAANLEPTKVAIKRYSDIVARGGWRAMPEAQLALGMTHEAVIILRERLFLSGDLKEQSTYETYFDPVVEKAVKRFQASNGLSPTGIVDKRTIVALNVPAAARLRQLKVNLNRLQEYARATGKRYLMVNIPAAQIEAVEGDRVVSRHSGVVGKIDRPSPLLRSAVHEINFNPVWTLPPTVIEKDLIPKGVDMQRKNQNVLAKYGIDAYDGNGRKLSTVDFSNGQARNLVFRQQPGKDNPLGFIKINFHNTYSVYMHDTPSETMFGRNFRAASSGCVRVQGIEQLTAWLLAGSGEWSMERILKMKESGERQNVRVKSPVQLYFVYITAWATEDGIVQFRRDLYNKDGAGETASAY